MEISKLLKTFSETYGSGGNAAVYFAPGRVNLIGEHTDYNGGLVLPCALSLGTYLVCRKTGDREFRFATTNFSSRHTVAADAVAPQPGNAWINYPLGVIAQFAKKGLAVPGMDFLFSGNIPNGSGLSSSASIEVLTAFAVNDMFGFGTEKVELALMSQRAEKEFAGVNCGIMDQFASAMGAENSAIALNCSTLEYELVPLELGRHVLIISNTKKQRGLASSKYNERRGECEAAVRNLSAIKPISHLCELDLDTFLARQDAIPDPVVRRRAKHAVSENQRVKEAVRVLKSGDIASFGKLMDASHESLRYDYEVTGPELDAMVEESRKIKGVLGSRMTGAGFGGCTVSLVHRDSAAGFAEQVGKAYSARTGLKPEFYTAEIGGGARKVPLT